MPNDQDELKLSGTTIFLRIMAVLSVISGILVGLNESGMPAGIAWIVTGLCSCFFLWTVAQVADRVASIDRTLKAKKDEKS